MSNNIKQTRDNLHISGYVHPTTSNSYSSKSTYKFFNTESKKDDYISSKPKSIYATFNDKNTTKQDNKCPDCGGEALYACDCEFNDKQCIKSHIWYTNKEGEIKLGDPH